MFSYRALTGALCAAVVTAIAFIGGLPSGAAAPGVPDLPETDNVFILPGASPDAWAPEILGQIDPWSTDNPRVRQIDENYYDCESPCNLRVIRYPRTAGPLFGPNAPFADESIAIGVDLTTEEIHNAEGPMVVAGLSLGSITADAVQRAIDADADRPEPDQLTFIVSGDPSRVTPVSTGIGSFLPEGFRIPFLGWTVARPSDDSAYDTIVVVGEYDFTADFPDRPWNLLAVFNSVVGVQYSHGPSALTDPDVVPKENITVTTNENGATTTTYLVPQPTLSILRPFSGVAPRVVDAANNVLKPIVDRGYSRNDVENGNRMPYLQPTDGLPRLVKGPRVTESFKAIPDTTALPRLDRAINTLGEGRARAVTPLQRLRDLTRNWRPQPDAVPVAAEEAS